MIFINPARNIVSNCRLRYFLFGINLLQRKNFSIEVKVQSGLLNDWQKSCSIF